jgi:hypothetical protein
MNSTLIRFSSDACYFLTLTSKYSIRRLIVKALINTKCFSRLVYPSKPEILLNKLKF